MKKFTFLFAVVAAAFVIQGCHMFQKSASGTILDASMNTLTIIDAETSDTLSFSTMGAERDVEDGILIGDLATVTYSFGKKPFIKADKIKVSAMPQLRILGSWVQPIPGMEPQEQGIKIMDGGKAESINMHTLIYYAWRLSGPDDYGKYTLSLDGRSIGNDTSFDFTEDYTIDCYTGDVLKLSAGELVLTYSREN